jgi:diguanylate cyclase (GGDEF)-like protein
VAQLRDGDLLARYGGEEFVIALYDCPEHEALEALERVRSATPEGQTCSAGIATLACDEDAHELVGRADAALYEAKRARNRTVLRPADALRRSLAASAQRAATGRLTRG